MNRWGNSTRLGRNDRQFDLIKVILIVPVRCTWAPKLQKIEFLRLKLQTTSPIEPLRGIQPDLAEMIVGLPSSKVIEIVSVRCTCASKLLKIEFACLKLQMTTPPEPLKGIQPDLAEMIVSWPSSKVI